MSGINDQLVQVGSDSWDLSCPPSCSMQGHNESRPDCSRFYQSSLVNLQEWRLQNLSSGLSAPLLNYPYTFFLPYIQSDPPISIYVCCLSSYHAPLTPSPRQPPCQPCQPAVRAPKAISSPG